MGTASQFPNTRRRAVRSDDGDCRPAGYRTRICWRKPRSPTVRRLCPHAADFRGQARPRSRWISLRRAGIPSPGPGRQAPAHDSRERGRSRQTRRTRLPARRPSGARYEFSSAIHLLNACAVRSHRLEARTYRPDRPGFPQSMCKTWPGPARRRFPRPAPAPSRRRPINPGHGRDPRER